MCGDEDAEGDWTCGMHIKPQCFAMTGYCDTADLGRVPWANVVPQSAGDGVGVFTSEICTCQNCPGADQEGAPETECGLECKGCVDE
ncbi:uncharacterized protein LTR77_004037 [Saxophila tyrrhenica]|uniref:Uncharacterized protein n=1 Tax=Saxophila tyrrhenica TaxID=1690608 RepID=A0AAV9PFV7_9PEZI|nr:hypothetical protein LTR77_004037 [Saxophila tyrrhenica]